MKEALEGRFRVEMGRGMDCVDEDSRAESGHVVGESGTIHYWHGTVVRGRNICARCYN